MLLAALGCMMLRLVAAEVDNVLSACSWNVWGQQPTLFLQTWRFVVTLIRSHTCRTLIMWAPAEVSLLSHMLTAPRSLSQGLLSSYTGPGLRLAQVLLCCCLLYLTAWPTTTAEQVSGDPCVPDSCAGMLLLALPHSKPSTAAWAAVLLAWLACLTQLLPPCSALGTPTREASASASLAQQTMH